MIVDAAVELAYESGRANQRHTSELEITTYRIVQEALTNAVKNGHATRGVVEVSESETMIEVSIQDDGAGFDPTNRTEGFGVLGMRERAALLHGTLDLSPPRAKEPQSGAHSRSNVESNPRPKETPQLQRTG